MQILQKRISHIVSMAIDSVLPARCIVSGELVERQGMLSSNVWSQLDFIVDPMCSVCGFPFDFEIDSGAQCASCLAAAPPYASARSVLKYNDTSRDIILGFKHADKTHSVTAFGTWLRRAGREMLESADILAPVPLHRWRLISRRYNQSAIIAKYLERETEIPVIADLLLRTRATPSQGHLKAKDRFQNIKNAFAVNSKHTELLKNKKIVLIDDVYTTGATVRECTKVLMKAGAERVDILTLARVVRPENY